MDTRRKIVYNSAMCLEKRTFMFYHRNVETKASETIALEES